MVKDYLIAIDTDLTITPFECSSPCTLEELRKPLNNGCIEFVHIVDDMYLIVDDEGLLKELPLNIVASSLVGFPLFGNAVLCRCEGEETFGFPVSEVPEIMKALKHIRRL